MVAPSLWQRERDLLVRLRRWVTAVIRRRRIWGVPDCDPITEPLPIVSALPGSTHVDGPVQP